MNNFRIKEVHFCNFILTYDDSDNELQHTFYFIFSNLSTNI